MGKRMVVVGGVAGGTSAAAKAKRENPELEVVVYEKGAWVSYGACGLPYVLSGEIPRLERLVARTPEEFRKQGVEVHTQHEVVDVDPESHTLTVFDHREGRTFQDRYDYLVLATGARPLIPSLPGTEQEGVFTLRSMEDGEKLLQALPRAKRAAILGAGYIGLEVAEAFRKRGLEVTLLEAKDRPLPHWDEEVGHLLEQELERHGVEVWTGVRVEAFRGQGRVEAVETSEGVVEADLVLLATGIRPNTALAQAMGVALGPTGAIATDPRMRTNLEGVYAAGDVAESFHRVLKRPYWLPLGDVANKHGRTAGTVIAGKEAHFPGVVGTAIFKAFSLAVATTGLSLEAALKEGFPARKVFIQSRDGAHYYPGSEPLWVELVYEEPSGRLLGGAVVAKGHGALRVDALAALLHQGGSLEDLLALDLAYAPPFSPVWDPLLIAAQQAK
ncbi:FAD-dependent oxidoreductase [Thermus sp.]|uniref:FAD-dependent oxidoreductase n=1 Tax=Thermus sp. TaxID=275 RepID=UPI0025EA5ABD|nr:FAD-dependent oxidoreductase [Thermus sp.]MCS6869569.1 FAD-dependent oxidoreductase [Thermus sp.]MCX7850422.1 FAD-dependent oxidoreductase [Thermus sp.]MDW8018126.1 FAD-dependent oxidoreductase [Thermus sp.]